MKYFMRNLRGRFATTFATLVTVVLVACGGGGGGGGSEVTPTPTTVTVTCPNGTSSTAATTALANAACPAPKLVSVTPENASTSASPDAFTAVFLVTDSTLDASSLTTANVTLKAGLTSVAGTVSATDAKGFKFSPTAKLGYGQAYSFSATVKDAVGKTLAVTSTFTTASITCTASQVPSTDGMTCVTPPPPWWPPATITPIGVKVFGANLLPAGCDHWTQDCWHTAVTDGTVKFIATSVLTPVYANRPLIIAYYRHNSTAFGTTGLWQFLIMYTDDGSPAGFDIAGGSASEVDWVYGTSTGIIWHDKSLNICGNFAFDVSIGSFANRSPVVCP